MSHKNKAEQLVEDYGLQKITRDELLRELRFNCTVSETANALLDALEWANQAAGQFLHAADHSNI